MKKFLTKDRWSPYTAGALIGLLSASCILFFNKSIGTSSTFSKIAAFFWSVFSGQSHEQKRTWDREEHFPAFFSENLDLVFEIWPPHGRPPNRNFSDFGQILAKNGQNLVQNGNACPQNAILGGPQPIFGRKSC